MAETCRQMLKDIGVKPERLALEWASAAEGPRYVELITQYTARITEMGPLGEGEGEGGKEEVQRRLKAATEAVAARKVRMMFANLAKNMLKDGDYGADTITDGVSKKVLPSFRTERISREIALCLAAQGSCDVSGLAELTGGSGDELEKILAALQKKGTVKEEKAGWALA